MMTKLVGVQFREYIYTSYVPFVDHLSFNGPTAIISQDRQSLLRYLRAATVPRPKQLTTLDPRKRTSTLLPFELPFCSKKKRCPHARRRQ